jgi:N-carbamoyl-L-amino-acid hydrolase
MMSNHSKVARARVDGARVLADLNALRAIGAYKSGVHRPTFSEPHIRSLTWLARRMPEASLVAEIDGIGNVLGTSAKGGPKLLAGSHLESQNFAGWLDGPLGVVYALEAARVINPDATVSGAVEVAAWCDEEGHFGHFLGSRSYVGDVAEADIDAARDRNADRTMRQALREVGLAGRSRARVERGRHIGYFEAHIEQGRTLESAGLKVGVVTSIVGIWQYRMTFTGEQNHAGTTQMKDRRDAGLALARLCVAIDDRFPALCGPRTVWTTGRISLDPGAPSIIPGSAEMLFQIRDDDLEVIVRLEQSLQDMTAEVLAASAITGTKIPTMPISSWAPKSLSRPADNCWQDSRATRQSICPASAVAASPRKPSDLPHSQPKRSCRAPRGIPSARPLLRATWRLVPALPPVSTHGWTSDCSDRSDLPIVLPRPGLRREAPPR